MMHYILIGLVVFNMALLSAFILLTFYFWTSNAVSDLSRAL